MSSCTVVYNDCRVTVDILEFFYINIHDVAPQYQDWGTGRGTL